MVPWDGAIPIHYQVKGKVMSNHIGYLVNAKKVLCHDCMPEGGEGAKLYDVNILPYRQTCHKCSKSIVEGQTSAWCELFPNPNPSTETKLTLVTINGISKMLNLPIIDGRPKISWAQIREHWNLPENACIAIG